MSFIKSLLILWDFNLHVQITMCLKLAYCSQNRPKLPTDCNKAQSVANLEQFHVVKGRGPCGKSWFVGEKSATYYNFDIKI